MLRPDPDRDCGGLRPAVRETASRSAAALAAVVLAVLTATALSAQRPATRAAMQWRAPAADSIPPGDLRCLTRRAEDCLAEPVPVTEPHGAVCATCHTLWDRGASGSTRSCSDGECHARPETLAAFHRSLSAATLADCTACHVPHAFGVPDRRNACMACHLSGGAQAARARPAPARRPARDPVFRHAEHAVVECTSCHTPRDAHGGITVTRIEACRSCHHGPPESGDCVRCHDGDELATHSYSVERTLDIRIGSLDRPTRTLVFDHARHATAACTACHTGPDLEAPAAGDCSSCHFEHHAPTADCAACHAPPAAGAHDRNSHLGCGGAGCHERAPAAIERAPRTRMLCLACHTDQREHRPDRNCADCHVLPPVRGASNRATRNSR